VSLRAPVADAPELRASDPYSAGDATING
jgi:hypothetical protein